MGFVFRRGLPSLVIFVISSPLLALHLSLVACIWGKLRQGKHKHDGDGQWLTNEFRKALCEAAARVVAAGFALRSKGKYDVGSRKDERKRHPFSFLLANQPFLYSIPSASACPASFLFVEDFPSGLAVWRMANGERLSSQMFSWERIFAALSHHSSAQLRDKTVSVSAFLLPCSNTN